MYPRGAYSPQDLGDLKTKDRRAGFYRGEGEMEMDTVVGLTVAAGCFLGAYLCTLSFCRLVEKERRRCFGGLQPDEEMPEEVYEETIEELYADGAGDA
jgi:hypothetical protein